MARATKIGLLTGFEWLVLLALWMAFVSTWSKAELLIGMAAAAIGAIADASVKARDFAPFAPKPSWLLLFLLLPGQIVKGSLATLKAFFGKLVGRNPQSGFELAGYDANGNTARSAAKRALAVAFLTIPPNSIIVGIDTERKQVLMHHIVPTPPSMLEKKLGVKA